MKNMIQQKTKPARKKGGFTLIEIALALVVIAIGLMGILSLVSVGLDSNLKSEHETRSALFAEECLNALRYYATILPLDDNSIQFDLDPPAAVFWAGNVEELKLFANNVGENDEPNVNIYRRIREGNPVEYAVRYKLFIGRVAPDSDIAWIYLQVWGGRFGNEDSPREYYTELFNDV